MLTEVLNIIIISGALSFMSPSTAETVITNRMTGKAEPTLTADMVDHDCYFAVPRGYSYLIGRKAIFQGRDGTKAGPYPIIDVQSQQARDMQADGLAADVTCPELVHRHGRLVVFVWD